MCRGGDWRAEGLTWERGEIGRGMEGVGVQTLRTTLHTMSIVSKTDLRLVS